MPLSQMAARNAKPREKDYKLADGDRVSNALSEAAQIHNL